MKRRMKGTVWQQEARRRWGRRIYWITGDGPYALLAPCRVLTITLHKTREEAEASKRFIDETACGGVCFPGLHEIVKMTRRRRPGRRP